MDEAQEQAARDKLAKATEARTEQAERMAARGKWKPTPTQEECDLVAMGVPVDKVGHAPSGAGPDPNYEHSRAMWPARKPGVGYETR
jgi:hypothetical protein